MTANRSVPATSTVSSAICHCKAGVEHCYACQGGCGFQDFAGAAEAYGALLQRSLVAEPADSSTVTQAAERMSALAMRAAALLRLGRYEAARADCDAALALLLHEQAHGGAGPGGSACNGAARPGAADAAGGATAASCTSADPGPGGLSNNELAAGSSCTKPVPDSLAGDSMRAPCSAHDALSLAHALAARLQKEAVPAHGLAGEGSISAGACLADACGQQGWCHASGHAADGSGGWGRGGSKLAMLLRLLVRRGSALAHDRRCGH